MDDVDVSRLTTPAEGALSTGDEGREDRREYLRTLDTDYVALRADQQTYNTVIAALFSLAVVLFGPLGYWLATSCDFTHLLCDKPGNTVPPELLAVVPIGPLGIIGFYAVLSNVNLMRSYYTRMVEAELQRVADAPEVSFRGGAAMKLPSFAHLTESLVSQRRGLVHYRLLNLVSVASLGVLFTGTTVLCVLFTRPVDLQVLAAAFYASAIVLLLLVIRDDTRGGLAMWRFATRLSTITPVESTSARLGRPLRSYLILPRPGDLINKGTIIPTAWALSAAVAGLSWEAFGLTVAFTAVFEFLFYQARYTINDLRGLGRDSAYSTFKQRNRFPPWAGRREVRLAIVVCVLRVAAAIWLALRVFPGPYGAVLLSGFGAVVIEAVLYEWLRAHVSPRIGRSLVALTPGRALILALVGAGYAIRTALGFVLGRPVSVDWTLVGTGAAMMAAFGSMFVTMTWAIDGVGQVVMRRGELLPAQRYAAPLEDETHIAPLLVQARILSADAPGLQRVERRTSSVENDHWRDTVQPLRDVSSAAWWNVAFVVACAGAGATGVVLARGAASTALVASAIGLAAAVLVLATHARTSARGVLHTLVMPLLAVIAADVALVLTVAHEGSTAAAVVWVPLALVTVVYLGFRSATRRLVLFDPAIVVAALRRGVHGLVRHVAVAIIGRDAADRLRGGA
ncbi:MAG: hypothetical protein ABR498_03405 [Candidatus Dormibacteria bacterium]